jgi:hypothetical protein
MDLGTASIGVFRKKWRARATVKEKILIRIAFHANQGEFTWHSA